MARQYLKVSLSGYETSKHSGESGEFPKIYMYSDNYALLDPFIVGSSMAFQMGINTSKRNIAGLLPLKQEVPQQVVF